MTLPELPFGNDIEVITDELLTYQGDHGPRKIRKMEVFWTYEEPSQELREKIDDRMEFLKKREARLEGKPRRLEKVQRKIRQLRGTGKVFTKIYVAEDAEYGECTLMPIHGLTSNGNTFEEDLNLKFAYNGYTVVVPDLVNHGKSGKVIQRKEPRKLPEPGDLIKEQLEIKDYSEPIYRMSKSIGVNHAIPMTSSWGAIVGASLAENHPDFVRALVSSGPVTQVKHLPLGKYYGKIAPFAAHLPENYRRNYEIFNWMSAAVWVQRKFRAETKAESDLYKVKTRYVMHNKTLKQAVMATDKNVTNIPAETPWIIIFSEKDSLSEVNREEAFKESGSLGLVAPRIEQFAEVHEGVHPIAYFIEGEVGHHIHREAKDDYGRYVLDSARREGYLPRERLLSAYTLSPHIDYANTYNIPLIGGKSYSLPVMVGLELWRNGMIHKSLEAVKGEYMPINHPDSLEIHEALREYLKSNGGQPDGFYKNFNQ